MSLPERWTLLRRGAGTVNSSTGNKIPGSVTEVAWHGLLQFRLVESRTEEYSPTGATSEMLLLLDPGLSGGTNRRDVWRFDGPVGVSDIVKVGQTVQVQGTPRTRRPVRGIRKDAYIVAVVKYTTDLME